jgi:hypothetical protein
MSDFAIGGSSRSLLQDLEFWSAQATKRTSYDGQDQDAGSTGRTDGASIPELDAPRLDYEQAVILCAYVASKTTAEQIKTAVNKLEQNAVETKDKNDEITEQIKKAIEEAKKAAKMKKLGLFLGIFTIALSAVATVATGGAAAIALGAATAVSATMLGLQQSGEWQKLTKDMDPEGRMALEIVIAVGVLALSGGGAFALKGAELAGKAAQIARIVKGVAVGLEGATTAAGGATQIAGGISQRQVAESKANQLDLEALLVQLAFSSQDETKRLQSLYEKQASDIQAAAQSISSLNASTEQVMSQANTTA